MRRRFVFVGLLFLFTAFLAGMSHAFGTASAEAQMTARRRPPSRIRRTRPLLLAATLLVSLAAGAVLLFSQGAGVTRASTTALVPVSVSQDTGEKPQSKVWQYNNTWWAVLPSTAVSPSGTWLWKLQPDNSWTNVLKLSNSTAADADVKPAGDVAHVLLHDGISDNSLELISVQYVPAGNTYQLWPTRSSTTLISLPSNSETSTIDIDSIGRMWLATDNGSNVIVYYSDSPYSSFSGPITLANNVNDDDISDVIAMPGNKVGLLWSNQQTKRFGFKTHVDGADPNTWSADEIPASQSALNVGAGMADDHLNMKVASDGTLYAAVKTSYDTSGYPMMALLVRRPNGTWDNLYQVSQSGTRPIMELNEAAGTLRVMYTDGGIVYKESPVSSISFGSAQTLMTGGLNNATSTKQNWSNSLVVLAGSGSSASGVLITNDATPTPPPVGTPTDTPIPTVKFTPTVGPSPTRMPNCGADGLVARYMMEENGGTTLLDSSPPANDGTITGTPAWAPGQVGTYALYVSGSTYATAANDYCLDITGSITLAAWVKPGQQATQDLVKKATNGGVNGYELSLASGGSTQKPFFRLNQVASGDTYRVNATTAYPYDGNTWIHLAGTYDGTTMRIYYNGVLQGSLAGPLSIQSNTLNLSIGAESNGARPFKGSLDEVRVYNRALSDAEIAALADLPPTPTPTPANTPTVTPTLMFTPTGTPVPANTATPTQTETPLPPAPPTLNAPPDGATGVSTSPTLDVAVSDSDGNPLTVTFYGRPVPTPGTSNFTVVVLPDTQSYISNPSYSPIFGAQTQWVANTKNSLNTVFVSHVGDIVESIDSSELEWTDASSYMATLDNNGVRSNVALGNHDMSSTGVAARFDTYFPVSRYTGFGWYGGYLGSEPLYDLVNRQNKDNYELFSVGSLDFLVIHLEDDVPSYALSWADRILKAYPNRRAIISTHAYLSASGSRPTSATYRTDDGNSAEAVWQQLIKPNCNVFLVVNGHYLGEARRTDLDDCGEPVYQVVQDYQGRANGGDGWLRYFTFDPGQNKIYAYTYSPTRNGGLGQFETDAGSQFTLDYDMQGSGGFQVIATNSGVPSGSNTTAVWQPLSQGTEYEWYVTVSDGAQITTGPVWTFTTEMTPAATATYTPTPTSTFTPTPTATYTPIPTVTDTPTPTYTPTPTSTFTPTPTATLCPDDADCDGVPDAVDNCPAVYNPDQKNSDGGLRPAGSQIPGGWASNPSQDKLGDACDTDNDNDGLPDASEKGLTCPYPLQADSDGDTVVDGFEVANGSNACAAASKPKCTDTADSDSDGLNNCLEQMGYNTCLSANDPVTGWSTCVNPVDSDNDGCADVLEVMDINGDRKVSVSDQTRLAQRAALIVPPSDSDPIFDVNKDGRISVSDQTLMAKNTCGLKPWLVGCATNVCPPE